MDKDFKNKSGKVAKSRPIPIALPKGDLVGLLYVSYPKVKLTDLVLPEAVRKKLTRIMDEQINGATLLSHGLEPRRKALLHGPPGSGKTMTAAAFAGELDLPLYVIPMDGLLTRFVEETATKLRLVFDAISEHRGIYFFDHFDSIGMTGRAGDDMHRALSTFLHHIELDESNSILVVSSKDPFKLDRTIFGYFDDVIGYGLPSSEQIHQVLDNVLSGYEASAIDWEEAIKAAQGLSYAEISKACEEAAKEVILSGKSEIVTCGLIQALEERRSVKLGPMETPTP